MNVTPETLLKMKDDIDRVADEINKKKDALSSMREETSRLTEEIKRMQKALSRMHKAYEHAQTEGTIQEQNELILFPSLEKHIGQDRKGGLGQGGTSAPS